MKNYYEMNYKEIGIEFGRELYKSVNQTQHENQFQELWQRCRDFGIFQFATEVYRDSEKITNIMDLMYGIGVGLETMSIIFSVNVHLWAFIDPIQCFASQQLKDTMLKSFCDGSKIGGHAISENLAGSDVFNLSTTYEKTDDGYILNGSKNYVTNAPYADTYIVYAREKGTKGFRSISCFLIDKNLSGFCIGGLIHKMGMQLSPMASIYMKNCFVEKKYLLGREGQGMGIFNYTMSMERPLLLAFQVGIMEAQLTRNVDFCKQRKQSGRTIIENQSISNRIADMAVKFEASKLLLKEIADQLKNKKNTYYMSSVAKLFISESLVANSLDSMRNMGTLGYMTEYQNEQQLRDSLGSLFYSGTSDIQRNIISSMI